jgi:hypothetical protein
MVNYSNPRMSAVIEGWPSGSKRVTATFVIEQAPRKGERAVRTTTGAPKKLTYAVKSRIVDGDDGRTYIANLTMYGHVSIMQSNMQFSEESIHQDDDRYVAVLALFAIKDNA